MNIIHFACCQTNALCLTVRTVFGLRTFLSTKTATTQYLKACLKYLMEIYGNYQWKILGNLILCRTCPLVHKKVILTIITDSYQTSSNDFISSKNYIETGWKVGSNTRKFITKYYSQCQQAHVHVILQLLFSDVRDKKTCFLRLYKISWINDCR